MPDTRRPTTRPTGADTHLCRYAQAGRGSPIPLALLGLGLGLSLGLLSSTLQAQSLHPYATLRLTHDDNLFRSPDANAVTDQRLRASAGLDALWRRGRQRFVLGGELYRDQFRDYSTYDHTGAALDGQWLWQAGERWAGDLGYGYRRWLRDFANQAVPAKDIGERHRLSAEARRWLDAHWQLGLRVGGDDIRFSASPALDKQRLSTRLRLEHQSLAGNRLGAQLLYRDVRFDDADLRDYHDLWAGPTVSWALSGKTRLEAEAGLLRRTHEQLGERDFSGAVGELELIWQALNKTEVTLTLYRDLNSLDDEVADYARVHGLRLQPVWQISAKLRLTALAAWEERDYAERPGLADATEDWTRAGLSLGWAFTEYSALTLGWEHQRRDSDRPSDDYRADTLWLEARIGF